MGNARSCGEQRDNEDAHWAYDGCVVALIWCASNARQFNQALAIRKWFFEIRFCLV